MQKELFTSEQLSLINDMFEAKLNFDTPVISAVFKPKMDNYTDEKWDEAMGLLHHVLPLQGYVADGTYMYRPFYQDEDTFNKSASVYVALKEYQENLKRLKETSDLYYYGSNSNKKAQLEHLNKFFNVVRFSKTATGPFWYALEVAIADTEDRGYHLLSQYISPRRIEIKNPQWIENENSLNDYPVGPSVYYDFGSDRDYKFFKKIASDLEAYQQQQAEYDNPLDRWEPKRILAYGMKLDKNQLSKRR